MTKGQDILDFILANRRGKAFKGFSTMDIMSTIMDAAQLDGLGMIERENGKLSAIAIGFPYVKCSGEKFLHIHSILTTQKGDLQNLLLLFLKRFPGFTITARRKGKFVKYNNTPRLINKLWATSNRI